MPVSIEHVSPYALCESLPEGRTRDSHGGERSSLEHRESRATQGHLEEDTGNAGKLQEDENTGTPLPPSSLLNQLGLMETDIYPRLTA